MNELMRRGARRATRRPPPRTQALLADCITEGHALVETIRESLNRVPDETYRAWCERVEKVLEEEQRAGRLHRASLAEFRTALAPSQRLSDHYPQAVWNQLHPLVAKVERLLAISHRQVQ